MTARASADRRRRRRRSDRARARRPTPGSTPSRFRPRSAPRNSSTNGLAGLASTSTGAPYCSSTPPTLSTAMRSPSRIASSMSWVTNTIVLWSRRWRLSSSSCRRRRTIGSTAPNGSSINSTGGSAASARATPTRCCCPPESSRRIARRELGLEPDELHQLLDAALRARTVPAEQLGHGRDVAGDRAVREQPDLLDHVADRRAAARAASARRCRDRPR